MSKETDSVVLKLTGAIVLDGQIARAGTLVEVTDTQAKQLLRRGKAVLATERNSLRTDGPTVAEYVAAGYRAEHYPPAGYAPISTEAEIQAAVEAQGAEDSAESAKPAKQAKQAKQAEA